MLPIPIRLLKNPWCCGDWRDSLSRGSTPGERIMRRTDERSGSLFSYVDLEARVPQNHPLRAIRALTNATLAEMSGDFEALYARTGRPGIAPEKLLRALLLQAFYSIRSERQLMEQLEFNLLFRWFVGLGVDERVWDADGIHQEPGASSGQRGGVAFSGTADWACGGETASVAGALLGGRDADRGVGVDQELPGG